MFAYLSVPWKGHQHPIGSGTSASQAQQWRPHNRCPLQSREQCEAVKWRCCSTGRVCLSPQRPSLNWIGTSASQAQWRLPALNWCPLQAGAMQVAFSCHFPYLHKTLFAGVWSSIEAMMVFAGWYLKSALQYCNIAHNLFLTLKRCFKDGTFPHSFDSICYCIWPECVLVLASNLVETWTAKLIVVIKVNKN